jgi:hypothetical protein
VRSQQPRHPGPRIQSSAWVTRGGLNRNKAAHRSTLQVVNYDIVQRDRGLSVVMVRCRSKLAGSANTD